MLKKNILSLFLILWTVTIQAQEDNSIFQFLKLPFSAHAASLGGENITVIEDDITMAVQNPALLSCVSNNTINFNYMFYFDGVKVASAAYSRVLGERSSWALAAQFVDYGKMKEYTEEHIYLGNFSAKDIAIGVIYSYDLSDYWSGGVKANLIYSKYAHYNSFAMGVDLGINYYNEYKDFSFSVACRNLGGQIVAFDDRHEKLPINLQVGITKRLAHAPFRISATLYNLSDWKDSKFFNHCALGIDFIPTETFYLALGYNFQRGNEMKINGSSHWAGLTAGAGIQIKRFKLGASYGKYHMNASSFLFNLAMTL